MLDNPYTVPYKEICVICNDDNTRAEIIEHSNCYGGSAWARYHYSKSPLVISTKVIGNFIRYFVNTGVCELKLVASQSAAGIESVVVNGDEVEITYAGLGGGGVGATTCRANAAGVLRHSISESGGGKRGRGTIVLPRRERLIVGIDDTDTKEEGATWTLAHNIASEVECEGARYLSHSLVQLYPVETRTQNCVSTALEFGCIDEKARIDVLKHIKDLLEKYTVSPETGMLSLSAFDGSRLAEYGRQCKSGKLTKEYALSTIKEHGVDVWMDGNGIIGALAAIPYVATPDTSVILKPQD